MTAFFFNWKIQHSVKTMSVLILFFLSRAFDFLSLFLSESFEITQIKLY